MNVSIFRVLTILIGSGGPLVLGSCTGERNEDPSGTAVQVTPGEFSSLKWIEGRRQGSGGKNLFHEIYSLVNDSTIQIDYYGQDSTFTRSLGTGTVYLSDGNIYHEYYEGGVWVADAIDSSSIHFIPVRDAGTTFLWEKAENDAWEATLWWKNQDGEDVKRVFTMSLIADGKNGSE